MTSKPARQLCPICAFDDAVETFRVDDDWVMTCSDESHPPFEWRPTVHAAVTGTFRSGVGVELGVYDDLLECVGPGFTEYGIIEHRFAERSPAAYRTLVDRYGHRAISPTKYSASSFLGGALGQLWREELLGGEMAKASGYWSYLSKVGWYAPAGTAPDAARLTWATFATDELGIDPDAWPSVPDDWKRA
ncbi:MAG TPA: hypothetical protein VGC79_22665 [Polyangiaceae bacterium]